MKAVVDSIGHGRRALLLGALAVLLFAAILGLAADPAHAAFAARVQAGVLTVSGDSASDKLALRLQPGSPNILQVDVGDDGSADFSFDRTTFTAVVVDGGAGDDQLRIDQSGGLFTDEAVTLDGGPGDDTLIGANGADTLIGDGLVREQASALVDAELVVAGAAVDDYRREGGAVEAEVRAPVVADVDLEDVRRPRLEPQCELVTRRVAADGEHPGLHPRSERGVSGVGREPEDRGEQKDGESAQQKGSPSMSDGINHCFHCCHSSGLRCALPGCPMSTVVSATRSNVSSARPESSYTSSL